MPSLVHGLYLDSELGVTQDLPHAGSTLEHPLVYDDAARELKRMAQAGLVEIVEEHSRLAGDESLIDKLRFRRLR
jgi:hypothetical protein